MVKDTEVEDEKISLSKNEFTALMARIEHLENPGIQRQLKRVKEHTGFLRIWEGELVLRVGTAKENFELSESHPDRLSIDIGVLTADGKQVKKTVNYLSFLTHSSKVEVKFLNLEHSDRVAVDRAEGGGGYGAKHAVSATGELTASPTGEEIPLEVGYTDVVATVEVLEGDFKGKQFTFEQDSITAVNA